MQVVPAEAAFGGRADGRTRDRDLQMVRRLDWRFLLPCPRLGDVLYLGTPDESLIAALQAFSGSVTVVPRADAGVLPEQDARFDLVVLRSAEPAAVAAAARVLPPGGLIYCEVEQAGWLTRRRGAGGRTRRGPFDGPGGARRCRRMLERAGFDGVEIYLHYPDFERCQRIVPVAGQLAVEHALCAAAAPWRRAIFRSLWRAGGARLFAWTAPCLSLVARRSRDTCP